MKSFLRLMNFRIMLNITQDHCDFQQLAALYLCLLKMLKSLEGGQQGSLPHITGWSTVSLGGGCSAVVVSNPYDSMERRNRGREEKEPPG
jgi:hypothetical protein